MNTFPLFVNKNSSRFGILLLPHILNVPSYESSVDAGIQDVSDFFWDLLSENFHHNKEVREMIQWLLDHRIQFTIRSHCHNCLMVEQEYYVEDVSFSLVIANDHDFILFKLRWA